MYKRQRNSWELAGLAFLAFGPAFGQFFISLGAGSPAWQDLIAATASFLINANGIDAGLFSLLRKPAENAVLEDRTKTPHPRVATFAAALVIKKAVWERKVKCFTGAALGGAVA